jgi:hypothetical protein
MNGVLSLSYTQQSCSVASCAGCGATSVNWSQSQLSWAGNTNTAGVYFCNGNVAAAVHGATVPASLTSANHVGSAQYSCNNGSWSKVSGSCDGAIVAVTQVSGYTMECSGTGVRGMWASWYLQDFARCGDTSGLNYWVNDYNTDTTTCQPGDNYKGYGNKDDCWRFAMFHSGDPACYAETQDAGHICPPIETMFCGTADYPWGTSNAALYGTTCKYPPP